MVSVSLCPAPLTPSRASCCGPSRISLHAARKTRCDGAHPTCSSCSRRSLRCNYVNDPTKARSRSSGSGGTPPDASASNSSRSSPVGGSSSVSLSTPSLPDTSSIVRPLSALDASDLMMHQHPAKKMRLGPEMSAPSIAVLNAA